MPMPIMSIDFPSLCLHQPHRASSAICPSNHARSRFQTALSGERVVMRTIMARPRCSTSSAFAFSPGVMPALVAGIHVFLTDRQLERRGWPR